MNQRGGEDDVLTTARVLLQRAGLPADARLLVACSGGGDSMALLHVLLRLGCRVIVAHLDHAARDTSAEEADWLAGQCHKLNVPFVFERHTVAKEARQLGHSFEIHARAVRYAFLVRASQQHDCAAIVTGHTASDQAETVLLRLLRGTGPAGLAGVPPLGMHAGVPVLRPLLRLSRDTLRAWLVAEGIDWREDPSNDDLTIPRNRVRYRLLPLLREEYNPAIDDVLARLADVAQVEDEWLRPMAATVAGDCVTDDGRLVRAPLAALPEALRRRVLMAWLDRTGIAADQAHLLALSDFACAAPVGARLSLPGGVFLYAGREFIEHVDAAVPDEGEVPLAMPGDTRAFGRMFSVRLVPLMPLDSLASQCSSVRQYFDADSVSAGLSVRTRRPGDRMRPFGAPGSRKVSDVLLDAGVPAPKRARVPLLLCNGEVIWITGGPVSQTVAVTAKTRTLVVVEIVDGTESGTAD